jgi:anthranilate phosphoribosyltransferase
MLLYSLWSTALPSSSGPSEVAELIGVDIGLSSAMLNFLLGHSCTWLDARRYLTSFASLGYLRKRLALPS